MPDRPSHGPCHQANNPCCLKHKGWRERSTGPEFPLLRLRCATHRGSFTVYPYGHVPHGRKLLVPIAVDGSLLEDKDGDGVDDFFQAARDAAAGKAWPKESWEGYSQGRFITQCRRLDRATHLTGVASTLKPLQREQVVACLEIEGVHVHAGGVQLQGVVGYRCIGAVIVTLLTVIQAQKQTYTRLLAAGYSAGLWSRPYVWERSVPRLRSLGLPWARDGP